MLKALRYKHLMTKAQKLEADHYITEAFNYYIKLSDQTRGSRYWEKYGIWSYLNAATISLENADTKQAYDMYLEVVEEMPENAYIYLKLGEAARKLSNHYRALEYLMRAYMLEGKPIFENNLEEWLYLKNRAKLSEQ